MTLKAKSRTSASKKQPNAEKPRIATKGSFLATTTAPSGTAQEGERPAKGPRIRRIFSKVESMMGRVPRSGKAVAPFVAEQQAEHAHFENVCYVVSVGPREQLLEIFEKRVAGDVVAKHFFLQWHGLPRTENGVVGSLHRLVEEGYNGQRRRANVVWRIGALYRVLFGGAQSRLDIRSKCVGVGDSLAILANADDDGENLLIDIGQVFRAPLRGHLARLDARAAKHGGSHRFLLRFQNYE